MTYMDVLTNQIAQNWRPIIGLLATASSFHDLLSLSTTCDVPGTRCRCVFNYTLMVVKNWLSKSNIANVLKKQYALNFSSFVSVFRFQRYSAGFLFSKCALCFLIDAAGRNIALRHKHCTHFPFCPSYFEGTMSYGYGGGGGGRRGRGRGGRGFGDSSRDRWDRGGGRGSRNSDLGSQDDQERGGGQKDRPPPHLKGRDIGMWYARFGAVRRKQADRRSVRGCCQLCVSMCVYVK